LVRPVSDEQQLQNLANLGESDLRQEYRDQVAVLKDLIYTHAPPKKIAWSVPQWPNVGGAHQIIC